MKIVIRVESKINMNLNISFGMEFLLYWRGLFLSLVNRGILSWCLKMLYSVNMGII